MARGFRDDDRESGNGNDPCDIGPVKCVAESKAAIRVIFDDDGRDAWFPKSVIHEDSEIWNMRDNNGEGRLIVKLWFARKEGYAE